MGVATLLKQGNPYSNVVPSGTATNNVSIGRTLDFLRLKLGGGALTKAMLSNIKVKANGKAIIDVSGTQLDKINSYKGLAADAGYIDVNFHDPSMLSAFDQGVGAFDSSVGIGSLTSEVLIAGATTPTLLPIIGESAAQKDATGVAAPYAPFLTKLIPFPFSISAGGRLYFPHVPYGPGNGAVIKSVYVFHTNMTGVVVKEDGLVIHESLRLENEFHQKRFGRVPQAGMYAIDFCASGEIGDALVTKNSKSLEWFLDFSGADSGVIIVEMLDTLPNN